MLQKVKLTQVYRGKQLVKKGTPDEKEIDKIAIKTEQHGDVWLSSFKTRGTEKFMAGQEVELSVEQNGDFYNFSLPSELEMRVFALEKAVFPSKVVTKTNTGPESEEINPDDIPF